MRKLIFVFVFTLFLSVNLNANETYGDPVSYQDCMKVIAKGKKISEGSYLHSIMIIYEYKKKLYQVIWMHGRKECFYFGNLP